MFSHQTQLHSGGNCNPYFQTRPSDGIWISRLKIHMEIDSTWRTENWEIIFTSPGLFHMCHGHITAILERFTWWDRSCFYSLNLHFWWLNTSIFRGIAVLLSHRSTVRTKAAVGFSSKTSCTKPTLLRAWRRCGGDGKLVGQVDNQQSWFKTLWFLLMLFFTGWPFLDVSILHLCFKSLFKDVLSVLWETTSNCVLYMTLTNICFMTCLC